MLEKMKKKFRFLKWLVVVPCALLSCVLLGSWRNDTVSDNFFYNLYDNFQYLNIGYDEGNNYHFEEMTEEEDSIRFTFERNDNFNSEITLENDLISIGADRDMLYMNLNNYQYIWQYTDSSDVIYRVYSLMFNIEFSLDFVKNNIHNYINEDLIQYFTDASFELYLSSVDTQWFVEDWLYMLNVPYNNDVNSYFKFLDNGHIVTTTQYIFKIPLQDVESDLFQSNLDFTFTFQNTNSILNCDYYTFDLYSFECYPIIPRTNSEILNKAYQYSNYDNLLQQYNSLYLQYQELLASYNNIQSSVGIDTSQYTLKLGSILSQNSIDFTPQYTLNTNDYLSASGYLDMYSIYEDYIDFQTYGSVLEVTCPVSNVFNKDLIYTFTGQPSARINLSLNVNGVDYVKSYELDNVNPDLLTGFSLLGNISYDTSISSADWSYCTYTKFYVVYTNRGNNLTSIQIGSNNGFNSGYISGVDSQKSIIANLNIDLQDLQEHFDSLQTSYNALNTNFLILQNQYNEIANSDIQLNFSTLIWNIASTPFEAFKTMWNFNFLGFNIYQFVSR